MTGIPKLSVVVIVHDMTREAPRTLYSLSAVYQIDVATTDYEVIVVDNGSRAPLLIQEVEKFGPNFRYVVVAEASPSPAAAINLGASLSRAPFVGIMIDGARIATPRVISLALEALTRFDRAIVATIGFHLGPDSQTRSLRHGYNRQAEDELLASIDWRHNGYRLFEISELAGSSASGWIGTIAESNLIFLSKKLFDDLEGFDERFDLPGGGLVNLDFFRRVVDMPSTVLVTLFGEATFHQIHGGVMTNRAARDVQKELAIYQRQYQKIHGVAFQTANRKPLLMGYFRPEITRIMMKTCDFRARLLQPNTPLNVVPGSSNGFHELSDNLPGAHNYRAFVGSAKNYDILGALQFNLVTLLGLRDHHYLLDFGCGSLRAGRLFIPYLQSGRYFGIEPNEWLVKEGIENELGDSILDLKRPRFSKNCDFDLDIFERSFDFILAQSILSHAGSGQINRFFQTSRNALRATGLMIATFVESPEDQGSEEWVYPGINSYSWQTIAGACAMAGFHCRKIDWPHVLQTWFVVGLDLDQMIQRVSSAGLSFLDDSTILTGWRFSEKRLGRAPGFYLGRLGKNNVDGV